LLDLTVTITVHKGPIPRSANGTVDHGDIAIGENPFWHKALMCAIANITSLLGYSYAHVVMTTKAMILDDTPRHNGRVVSSVSSPAPACVGSWLLSTELYARDAALMASFRSIGTVHL